MKRTQLSAMLLATILLITLSGCGSRGGEDSESIGTPGASDSAWNGAGSAMDSEGTGDMNSEPEKSNPPDTSNLTSSSVYHDTNAKLIRRANMTLQTTTFEDTVKALEKLVSACGGYSESSSVYGGGYWDANSIRSGDYVIRVPADKYESFLNSAGTLGYVSQKTETTEDVGEQYYDTEARLKTQRTKQERLQALLEKAEVMEDIISLENALTDVEYQIEQLSSELNRYDSLIGFASIQITLEEVREITEDVGDTTPLLQRMGTGLAVSFRNLENGAQSLLIWFSYNFTAIVLLCVIACATALLIRKRKRKICRQTGQKPSINSEEDNPVEGPKR